MKDLRLSQTKEYSKLW